MKKTFLIVLAALMTVSCDLLFNRDSDSIPPTNDIAVTAINTSPSATIGEVIKIDVTVMNPGNLDVKDEIEITLINRTEGVIIGTSTIAEGLARSDSVILSYSWDTRESLAGDHTIVAAHNIIDDNVTNDSLMAVLKIIDPDITDLAIVSVSAPDMVNEGETVEVGVTVKNVGNQEVNNAVTIILKDKTTGIDIGSQTVDEGITIGDSVIVTFNWDTEGEPLGVHDLEACHRFGDENPANDSLSQSVTVNEAQAADLAITQFDVRGSATQGENIPVSVTVQNIGNLDTSESFEIILRDQTDDIQLAQQTISDGLASGNKVVISFNWDTDQASIGEHTLIASQNLKDINDANDTLTTQITINEIPVTDIAIINVSADPTSTYQGEKKVVVSVTVVNLGNQDVKNALNVTLTDQTDGKTIETKILNNGLSEGSSETLTFMWDTQNASVGNHILVVVHGLDDDDNANNTGSVTVFVDEPPFIDVEVISISAAFSARLGDKVTVTAQLRNGGNRDINESITVTLIDETDTITIDTDRNTLSAGLDEGEVRTVTFEWDTKGASRGDHTLTVSHDLNDDNRSNDSRSHTIAIIFLDIAITGIEANDRVEQGDVLNVKVTLENKGNWDITQSITVMLFDQEVGSRIGDPQVIPGGLQVGKSVSIFFNWFTFGVSTGPHTLLATHDFDDDDDTNNSRSIVVTVEI